MPSSAVRHFADPDAYAASLRATSLDLVLSQRGSFSGRIVRVDLHDLWLQRFSENLGQVGHSAITAARAVISFYAQPGPDQVWNGRPTGPAQLVQHSEAEHFYRRSSGASDRMALSLPSSVAASVFPAVSGASLSAPHIPRVLTPSPRAMCRLRRLHGHVGRLAEQAPEIIANAEVARGLEQ